MREQKPLYIVDIGELGWSLYLSAHYKWLKTKGEAVRVITYPDRFALYPFADGYSEPPDTFFKAYGYLPNECFGKRGVASDTLLTFFARHTPFGSIIVNGFGMDILPGIYKDYVIPKKILVFPRYRSAEGYAIRNLSKEFYNDLIYGLCKTYPQYDIVALGKGEAYSLDKRHANFINKVTDTTTIQDVLEQCHFAVAAIGGASALPKLSALQGVPTYVIGHEKERVTVIENWAGTRCGFYEIGISEYNNLKLTDEIFKEIKDFIESLKNV